LLTEEDLQPLPELVQNYLKYVGVVGKPRVKNMRVVFKAQMRSKTRDWFSFEAEQYNFYDQSERLFFLDARLEGLPTQGYHFYKNGKAGMMIKLLSLFPVVDVKGEELFKAETVTLFCLVSFCPIFVRIIETDRLVGQRHTSPGFQIEIGCCVGYIMRFN
jgi:hypothetical protein